MFYVAVYCVSLAIFLYCPIHLELMLMICLATVIIYLRELHITLHFKLLLSVR